MLHVPERIFEHHNRGVDHHADAEGEAAERHDVQREACEEQQRERAHDRDRNRRADDQRGSEAAEEEEDDERDENRSDDGVLLHGADRSLDVDRAVVHHGHLDVGHLAVDARDLGPHEVRNLHGVGARLLLHLHAHARLAVDAQQRADVFGGVLDVGHVADIDRHAVARHEHEIADFVEALKLRLIAEQVRAIALIHLAERRVLVLVADQRADAIDGQIERRDFFFRELHVNLASEPAARGDRGHAVHSLEPGAELVFGNLTERDAVVVAFHAEAHDRHGVGILPEDDGRIGVDRQPSAHAVQARAQVVHGGIQIGAPRKRHANVARALLRGRVHLFETRDRADRLLDGARDDLLHLQRPDTGVIHADADRGIAHIRQQIHREPRERNGAEQNDHGADHEHRDGSPNCGSRNAHAGASESMNNVMA